MDIKDTDNLTAPAGRRVLSPPDARISFEAAPRGDDYWVTCDTSYVIEGDSSGPKPLPLAADQSLVAAVMTGVLKARFCPSAAVNKTLASIRQQWFEKCVTEKNGEISLAAGAVTNIPPFGFRRGEVYLIDTGLGGSYYRALASKDSFYTKLKAQKLEQDHMCSFSLCMTEGRSVWAVKGGEEITLSFGEGVAVKLCHHLSRETLRAVPADTVGEWRNILDGSQRMTHLAEQTIDLLQQVGSGEDGMKQAGSREYYVEQALDRIAATLRGGGLKCTAMRSFPLHEEASHSEALFSIQLPSGDTRIVRGLQKLGFPLVSVDIVKQITPANRVCIVSAVETYHKESAEDDILLRMAVDNMLKNGGIDEKLRQQGVSKVTSMISQRVDDFISQLVHGLNHSEFLRWKKAFEAGVVATRLACWDHIVTPSSRQNYTGWTSKVKVTPGQYLLSPKYRLRVERKSTVIDQYFEAQAEFNGANAVLVAVTTDSYPQPDSLETERYRAEARSVVTVDE